MKIVSDYFNFVTNVSSLKMFCIRYSRLFHLCLSHKGGARFWFRGGTSDKISYMNSSQVLYCNGVAKISVLGGHSAKMYSSKNFENF